MLLPLSAELRIPRSVHSRGIGHLPGATYPSLRSHNAERMNFLAGGPMTGRTVQTCPGQSTAWDAASAETQEFAAPAAATIK